MLILVNLLYKGWPLESQNDKMTKIENKIFIPNGKNTQKKNL